MTTPNILIISLNCLRADHLSCYGYHRDTTPNIDYIAKEGMLFEKAYSTAAWTPPAYASLLTGKYLSSHGVLGDVGLSDLAPNVVSLLNNMDYYTIGFTDDDVMGKLKNFDRDFKEFYWRGYKRTSKREEFRRKLSYLSRKASKLKVLIRWWMGSIDKGAKNTTSMAIKWLTTCGKSKHPFFMLLGSNEIHPPFFAPSGYRYRYIPYLDFNVNWYKIRQMNNNFFYWCKPKQITCHDREVLKALYDAEIHYVDKLLGQLFAHMRKLNLLDSTFIVISSPHGELLGEHELFRHGQCLYEPMIRIPLIIRYPTIVPYGMRVQNLAQLTDILPTILEVIGCDDTNIGLQGHSLLPTQNNHTQRKYIIAEWEGCFFDKSTDNSLRKATSFMEQHVLKCFARSLQTIRIGDYKYIRSSDGDEELFNLIADPNELHNLATQELQQTREMATQLKKIVSSFKYRDIELEEPNKVEKNILENLRDMGYRI